MLGVKASATQDEISKAHRKKSKQIHPDRAKQSFIAARAKATPKTLLPQKGKKKPGVHVNKAPSESEIQKAIKTASDRYARLGVVADILKGSGRERYDYFLTNGFPKWRGTGYYYARFRPGLGTVLVGLFAFGGGLVHYAALYVSWKRQREFVERYIRHARRTAWGDEAGVRAIPGVDGAMTGATAGPPAAASFAQENGAAVLNRRQKRMQEKEAKKPKDTKGRRGARSSGTSTPTTLDTEPEAASGPQGSKKKVQAENGKVLIVDSVGNVFLEEENENGERGEYLLDPDEIPRPTISQTVLFRLPVWVYEKVRGRVWTRQTEENTEEADVDGVEDDELPAAEKKRSANGTARKRGKRGGQS